MLFALGMCFYLNRMFILGSALDSTVQLSTSGQLSDWGNVTNTSLTQYYLNGSKLISFTEKTVIFSTTKFDLKTTTFPSIEEVIEDSHDEKSLASKSDVNLDNNWSEDNRYTSQHFGYPPPPQPSSLPSTPVREPQPVKRESWFQKIKNLFHPTSKMDEAPPQQHSNGAVFTEKYGSSGFPQPTAHLPLYQNPGPHYPPPSHPVMFADGGYAPVYKPDVSLSLTADFIELNCEAHGRIQHGIRWVKLVHGYNNYGHQLFATVADGERILFDTYHFGVRTDGRNSRLIIRNPDPKTHYGIYQCQASVAGNPSLIVKEDFVVGKIT